MPQIGEYDKWAIKWGYTWFPPSMSDDEVERTLDKWIAQHDSLIYHFGNDRIDPRSDTEELGHNSVKASRLGVSNLKVIVDHLIEWTERPYVDFDELETMYNTVLGQWNLYMGHVSAHIGGVYELDRTYSGEGPVYKLVPEDIQRNSMNFLINYAFETPGWLLDDDIISLINQDAAVESMREIQVGVLYDLLDPQVIGRLIEWNARTDEDTYTAIEMLDQLRDGVWNELDTYEDIDVFRRNLQRAYLERMEYLMREELPDIFQQFGDFFTYVDVSQSDIRPLVRDQLNILLENVREAQNNFDDRITEAHLQGVEVRIQDILDGED